NRANSSPLRTGNNESNHSTHFRRASGESSHFEPSIRRSAVPAVNPSSHTTLTCIPSDQSTGWSGTTLPLLYVPLTLSTSQLYSCATESHLPNGHRDEKKTIVAIEPESKRSPDGILDLGWVWHEVF